MPTETESGLNANIWNKYIQILWEYSIDLNPNCFY